MMDRSGWSLGHDGRSGWSLGHDGQVRVVFVS